MDISIHGPKFKIVSEYPENSLSIVLDTGQGSTISLYFREQFILWTAFRSIFPKAKDYVMHTKAGNLYEHRDAERFVTDFLKGQEG
jgi:hypothetical protein